MICQGQWIKGLIPNISTGAPTPEPKTKTIMEENPQMQEKVEKFEAFSLLMRSIINECHMFSSYTSEHRVTRVPMALLHKVYHKECCSQDFTWQYLNVEHLPHHCHQP